MRSLICWDVMQCWLLVTDILGPIVCPETLVTDYQSVLRNNPEECRCIILAAYFSINHKINR